VLIIGFTQLRVGDQAADALPLPPELHQQRGVFISVGFLELHPNALRQGWALPSRGNRDLQRTTVYNGRGDEITGLRRVDDVHPDVTPPSSLAYGLIHRALIGGPDHQHAAHHVGLTKCTSLILYEALCDKTGKGFGESRADHNDGCARLKKPLYLASGDSPAADH
jgi:hypothetical protein